jgi:hypothetical protein
LEESGAIGCLTKTLIRLYEEEEKPDDSCKYIRKFICESCPDDDEVLQWKADLDEARKTICDLKREMISLKGNM